MNTIVSATDDSVAGKPKSKLMKVLKYFVFGMLYLTIGLVFLNWIWMSTGSNEWELEIDEDGTQVYSLKSPGSSNVKFKGITTYDYTYSHMLSLYIDEAYTGKCEDLVPGCVEYEFLNSWDPQKLTNTQYWRIKAFFPFSDREMVLNGKIRQNPETKEILLENTAAPNIIEPNDCCVRVTHLHNTWRYIPLESGGVRVEYIQDFDLGGFFPDFMISLGAAGVYQLMHTEIPKFLDDDTLRNASLDFIEEY